MKRLATIITLAAIAIGATAIEVENTAGQLSLNLTDLSIEELTVKGTIDARDVMFIGDKLTHLVTLNLGEAQIVEYSDPQATLTGSTTKFEAGTLPPVGLMNSPVTSITLPAGLKVIGQAALAGCKNLTTITLPESLEVIEAAAFSSSGLTSINLPASVTHVGERAFSQCAALESAVIANVAEIGNYAFLNDAMLSSVTLGEGVKSIGDGTFSGCTALKAIGTAQQCAITKIGAEAFAGSGLESIDLAAMPSLTQIGAWAFSNTALQEINVPDNVKKMGEGVFFYNTNLTHATLPTTDKFEAYTMAGNSQLVAPDIVAEGIESIGNYTFYRATAIDSIVLPTTLKYIGTRAMAGMTGLKDIVVLGDVALLGDSVWAGVDQPAVRLNTMRDTEVSNAFGMAEQWRDFHILLEYLLGDVNNDTRINVLDITTTIEYIMHNNPLTFIFPAADVAVDNTINVLDITGIVGLIMDREYTYIRAQQALNAIPAVSTGDALTIDGLYLQPRQTASVGINLSNSTNYTAMQCDITLTGGLQLADLNASTTERTRNHQVAINKLDDDTYRVVLFAINNTDIEGYDGNVLTLNVSAGDIIDSDAGIKIDNIYYADREQDYIADSSFTPVSTITGVNQVNESTVSVRADHRTIIIEATTATIAQIVNASGIATTVNVAPGTNTFPVESGIYIVRTGKQVHKVAVK